MIPYGKQLIDDEDVQAVVDVLRSDWLTTGPKVEEFEHAVADYVGAKYAVAVSSGTAALHCGMFALSIGPGDEVIVPPMTFAATVNCVVYQGGTSVFVDIDPETLLIDPAAAEAAITENTKAIIAVDYAGQPCDYDRLSEIASRNGIALVADSCHALGAEYKGLRVGSLAEMTVFSFHPVKHITTGEGGMITTNNPEYAERMRLFRNHGITTDHRQRDQQGSWFYEMEALGYNYRITDIQCALGISQLKKLSNWIARRQEIAERYNEALAEILGIAPLGRRKDLLQTSQCQNSTLNSACSDDFATDGNPTYLTDISGNTPSIHGFHLYVVKIDDEALGTDRDSLFHSLRAKGIGVNVHYIPVHLHPFYQKTFDYGEGLCPVAEKAYREIISLPMFAGMLNEDVETVIRSVKDVVLK